MTFKHVPEGQAQKLHYIAIDGTDPIDSLAFANNLRLGFHPHWESLLKPLVDATNPKRRDPGQPLLMRLHVKRSLHKPGSTDLVPREYADDVVLPQGQDSEHESPQDGLTDADVGKANEFCRSLIVSPGIQGKALSAAGGDPVADLVFVSSHGITNGQMYGAWPRGNNTIFDLGESVGLLKKFEGPRWLFLSNCYTLDERSHNDWIDIMAPGSTLRGVVGFRNLFPDAETSALFYEGFLAKLRTMTFVEAWRKTSENYSMGDQWRVICHREAAGDTMSDFTGNKLQPLPASAGDILKFDADTPSGAVIQKKVPDFEGFFEKGGARVTPRERSRAGMQMREGEKLSVVVTAPRALDFAPGDSVSIRLVYIRPSYDQVIDVPSMFTINTAAGCADPKDVTFERSPDVPRDPHFNTRHEPGVDEVAQFAKSKDMWNVAIKQAGRRLELSLTVATGVKRQATDPADKFQGGLRDLKHDGYPVSLMVTITQPKAARQVGDTVWFSRDAIVALKP